jgi:hypothetical protein
MGHNDLLSLERWPRRRAANPRDELAAFDVHRHAITLSAKTSNVFGTFKPSALAVLMLGTNSKRVAC